MRAHTLNEAQFLVEVGNKFQKKNCQSKCRVIYMPMNMQLHISSMVGFVVSGWGFFFEDVSKQKCKPSSRIPFFFFQCLCKGFDLICIYGFIL